MTDRHHDAARDLVRRAHEADPERVELDTAAGLAALLERAETGGGTGARAGLRRSARLGALRGGDDPRGAVARQTTFGAVAAVAHFDHAPNDSRARRELALRWTHRLIEVAYIPLAASEVEAELTAMLDSLCELLHAEPFAIEPVERIGRELAALGHLGESGLRRTTEVLGEGLPALPEFQPVERCAGRIARALGAVGNGFATARTESVLEQQESMQRALLKVAHDANQDLRAAEMRFDEVVTSSRNGILLAALDGRLLRTNDAVGGILGREPYELAGLSLADLVAPDAAEPFRDMLTQLRDGTSERFRDRLPMVGARGEAVTVSLAASVLRDATGKPSQYVVVIEDETELLLLSKELMRQARHDAVTGLPNRGAFTDHLEAALRRADPRYGVTLFHLGLDAFDLVCGSLGRRAGETLLQHVAQQLRSIMARERAMVARLDGDEFGIVVENSAQTPDVAAVMDEISDVLTEPVHVDGIGLSGPVSAGIVHWPAHDADPAELLRAAESTLHRARSSGRGQWRLFRPGQDADDALAVVMPGAWENGEIAVRYRPVRDLRLDAVTAVEAELCWERPDAPEPLPHDRCAALAERTGLALPLGEWLLRLACGQVRWWRQRKQFDGPLAVRLTAHQATDAHLVPRLVRVLAQTGFDAHQLMLSMPAGVLPKSDAVDNLTALADLGVYTVVDDFGLGPLEVAAVRDLPVRCVRLPRELIPSRVPDVTTLLPLMRQEGVAVAVDGIDSAETARWWRDAGADFGVGAPSEAGQLVQRLGLM